MQKNRGHMCSQAMSLCALNTSLFIHAGFTEEQIRSKMRRMSKEVLGSPSRSPLGSQPSTRSQQPTPAGPSTGPSAAARGAATVSPFARRPLANPAAGAQQQQQPASVGAKRALYQPAAQQAVVSGSGYLLPLSPLGPGGSGRAQASPRAQPRKQAAPARAKYVAQPKFIIHRDQHTPLRQKVQEVLQLAPGQKVRPTACCLLAKSKGCLFTCLGRCLHLPSAPCFLALFRFASCAGWLGGTLVPVTAATWLLGYRALWVQSWRSCSLSHPTRTWTPSS